MSIPVRLDFEATLRTQASARGIDLPTLVEQLVRADKRPIADLTPEAETILESALLDHSAGAVGQTYFSHLKLEREIEKWIYARALAAGVEPEDYLRSRLDASA